MAKKVVKKKGTSKTKVEKDANVVTLSEICKDCKVEPTVARGRLRRAGLKPDGRWEWKKGSKDLKKAEEVVAGSDE